MIILEGSDLVGKTTLAHKLVDKLNRYPTLPEFSYQHLSRLPDDFAGVHGHLGLAEEHGINTVWDRFHPSELCYSWATGRRDKLHGWKYDYLESRLQADFCAFVVVLVADEQLLQRRWIDRGDDMYDWEVILKVNRRFHGLVSERGYKYFYVPESPGDTYEKAANWIVSAYADRRLTWSLIDNDKSA